MFVHLVVIGWLYVVVMMAVAEATSPQGTVLGASLTFALYGLAPVALVVYLLGAPGRRRAAKEREIAAQQQARRAASAAGAQEGTAPPQGVSELPDAGGKAAADAVAPVREKP